MIPIDNSILEEIEQLAEGIKEDAVNQLDGLKSKKESLDNKYKD